MNVFLLCGTFPAVCRCLGPVLETRLSSRAELLCTRCGLSPFDWLSAVCRRWPAVWMSPPPGADGTAVGKVPSYRKQTKKKIQWESVQSWGLFEKLCNSYFSYYLLLLTFAWLRCTGLCWWHPSCCRLWCDRVRPGSAGTGRAHSPPETSLKKELKVWTSADAQVDHKRHLDSLCCEGFIISSDPTKTVTSSCHCADKNTTKTVFSKNQENQILDEGSTMSHTFYKRI